ncbi:MAG: hemolysin family protein [Bacteriovoracaceae bacterium]
MEASAFEYASLVICLFASGFYSGSEAILMSIGLDRARQLIDEGGAKGKALSFMIEKPNELLTTILVGNNIVNIYLASLTTILASRAFKSDVVGIAVGITTIAILIFGEIIPKTFGRRNAELLSLPVIRILQINYYIILPVVNVIAWLTNKVLGKNASLAGRIITKDDIEYLINKAEKEKTMDSKQIDMINSILEFPTIKVKDIMISRSKVKYIPSEFNFDEVVDYVSHDVHSRYPVARGDLDHCLGFLHVKDLAFLSDEEKEDFDINNILKAPFFVYEHMKIQAVFDHMNRKKVHLALVKDENGLTVGIITLEDIVEEVLGEIQDEHDLVEQKAQEEYKEMDLLEGVVVEGSLNLRDLYNDLEIKIPLNDNYSTVSGFILDMLGNNFPEEGQIIVWEGLSFELKEVNNHIIEKVKIKDVDGEKHFFSKTEATTGGNGEESL